MSTAQAYRDVTQPAQEGKSLDRGAHILAFIDELREPLMLSHRTLRSRLLETSGMHHNFWGVREWAQRVVAKSNAHMQRVRENNAAALADLAKVEAKMRADGIDPAVLQRKMRKQQLKAG